MNIEILFRDSFRDLHNRELSLLLDAQRAVIEAGGTLGLYDDFSFVIAWEARENEYVGILACRADGEDVWLQIAYVVELYRRERVFSKMMHACLQRCPSKRFGLGTQPANVPMITAAAKFGFRQEKVFLYRPK